MASIVRQLQHAVNQFLSQLHGSMWGRLTDPTRRVIVYAQQEAQRLGWNTVSTEHLLLGILRERDNVAVQILYHLHADLDKIHEEVNHRAPTNTVAADPEDMQLMPEGKQVIDFAGEEAVRLSGKYIGTEHILLGLIREESGIAGQVLRQFGIDLNKARSEVALLRDREL